MDKVIYFSYLLRVWRIIRNDELIWMASLEDPCTGKRQSFTSLEDIYAFLLKDIRQVNVQNRLLTGDPNSTVADQRKMDKTNRSTKGEKP